MTNGITHTHNVYTCLLVFEIAYCFNVRAHICDVFVFPLVCPNAWYVRIKVTTGNTRVDIQYHWK